MGVTYLPRSSWNARPPDRRVSGFARRLGICLHHGASGNPRSVTHARSVIRGYQNWHMDRHGWADIAYNFLIDPWGNVYTGRGWNTRSGANGTTAANAGYLALCIVGHSDRGSLTQAAKASAARVRADAMARGFGSRIVPHGDFTGSACPGTRGRAFARNIREWNIAEERSWFDMASKADLEEVVRDVVRDELWRVWQYKGAGNQDAWSKLNALPEDAAHAVWAETIGHGANLRASTLLSRLQGRGLDEVPEDTAHAVWAYLIGHGADLRASTLLSRLQGGGLDEVLAALEDLQAALEDLQNDKA